MPTPTAEPVVMATDDAMVIRQISRPGQSPRMRHSLSATDKQYRELPVCLADRLSVSVCLSVCLSQYVVRV